MGVLFTVLYYVTLIYFYVLWARVIVEFVRQVKPDWRPRGALMALFVGIYKLTDPPIWLARKVIKPVRVGGALIDLSVLVVMVVLLILMWILGALQFVR